MGKDQINILKWSLEDIRNVTLSGVKHLTGEQLFNEPVKGEFPIGSYLMHFAECDLFWLECLSGKKQSEELCKKAYSNVWFDPFETSAPPAEPLQPQVYLDVISETRKLFLDHLDSMDDSELDEIVNIPGNSDRTLSKKWIIYHIIEHEAHHRGQMFMLIRQAGWSKKK